MKDTSKSSNRKSSLGGCGGGSSECKVTFQVPHQSRGGSSSAITGESKSERGKGGDPASNRKTTINNNRKSAPASSQKHYPEYFRKGSTIRLGNGALKKVEELSSADFIDSVSASTMSSSSSAFGASGKFKVEQSEVLAIGERSNRRSPGTGNNLVRITFLVGSPAVAVSLESPLEHPFFVVAKGWSSCSPSSTLKRYGLQCQRLAKGDSVVTLASRTTTTPGTPSKSGTSLLSSSSSPRSLASSSGSLSSSSSSSSSTSTTASPLLNCPPPPPPAHHLGSLLSSSSSSAAAAAAIRHHSNQHNLESSGVLNLDTKTQQEEDEEIDVENVDEQQQS
ncbi:Ataxin 1 [Tyrophagus putrescentiae]|nr:Ataxin 1 [Tyrophagus putrescentiae]